MAIKTRTMRVHIVSYIYLQVLTIEKNVMMTELYERVLGEVLQLSPDERRRLRDELETMEQSPEVARKAKAQQVQAKLDDLAAKIGATWQGGGTAEDVVREQRRER